MLKSIKEYRSYNRQTKLLRLIHLPNEGKVLDASSGNGTFLRLLHEKKSKLALWGTDISAEQVQRASQSCPFARFATANSSAMPFKNEAFDIVFCNMSFHHYEHANKVMEECGRVLKSSGSLYIMDVVPKNKIIQRISNYLGCYEPYHFEKFYMLSELESMALQSGLQLKSSTQLAYLPTLLMMIFFKTK